MIHNPKIVIILINHIHKTQLILIWFKVPMNKNNKILKKLTIKEM